MSDVKRDVDEAAALFAQRVETVFFLAGDPSVVRTSMLCDIAEYVRRRFPALRRIGMYAHAVDILRRPDAELEALRCHGIERLYVGIESGNDDVLARVRKGVTARDIEHACKTAIAHRFVLSVQIILGLGGRDLSVDHARDTARILGAVSPNFVGALSLVIYPDTELGKAIASGEFVPVDATGCVRELETIIGRMVVSRPCVFRANHPSNPLAIAGTLPDDREKMLALLRSETTETSRGRSPVSVTL